MEDRVTPRHVGAQELFAQHPSVMLLVDPDNGQILDANPAAVAFYGWDRPTLLRMRIGDINVLSASQVATEMQAARRQQRGYFAFRHRTASGRVVPVEVYSGPVVLDGRELLYSVVHEATERHRAVASLQASEELARQILAYAPLGIAVLDHTGCVVRTNEALARMVGRAREGLLGQTLLTLIHPDARSDVQQLLDGAASLDGDSPATRQTRLLAADGRVVDVEVSRAVLRDEVGNPVLRLVVVQDVTERNQATEEARTAAAAAREAAARADEAATRLLDTMESVTDGILLLDADDVVTYANPQVETILHRSTAQVLGARFVEVFPAAAEAEVDDALRHARDCEQAATAVTREAPGGGWLEVRAYPSSQGRVVYLRDVTDREERERALASLAEAERADAERLRQLDDAKTAFLSAVSHELRTPLTVVRGMAETLVTRRGVLPAEARTRVEDALLHHTIGLGELLDDLLHLDRLSRGALVAERVCFDLAAALRSWVADAEVAATVELDAPEILEVAVDPVQVEHIVTNLLSNAAKYAPDSTVEVRLVPGADGGCRIEVRDNGPGIPASLRTRVFEPFFRADEDHASPGTGVGLALVAAFAELHGGRAWVADDDRPGARFVVELAPAAPDEASGCSQAPGPAATSTSDPD